MGERKTRGGLNIAKTTLYFSSNRKGNTYLRVATYLSLKNLIFFFQFPILTVFLVILSTRSSSSTRWLLSSRSSTTTILSTTTTNVRSTTTTKKQWWMLFSLLWYLLCYLMLLLCWRLCRSYLLRRIIEFMNKKTRRFIGSLSCLTFWLLLYYVSLPLPTYPIFQ